MRMMALIEDPPVSVVIIGSHVTIEGSGATLVVRLSEQLAQPLGEPGKWLFLIGAAGAVFSSLLGVWQATPYIFADAWSLIRTSDVLPDHDHPRAAVNTNAPPYRVYLWLLALVPMAGLFISFREAQKLYTITGAFFMPMLALVLLLLNGRSTWIGDKFRNGPATTVSLAATLAFFIWVAVMSG
jgi:hypothetical protein